MAKRTKHEEDADSANSAAEQDNNDSDSSDRPLKKAKTTEVIFTSRSQLVYSEFTLFIYNRKHQPRPNRRKQRKRLLKSLSLHLRALQGKATLVRGS